MDRNFLIAVVVMLGVALGVVYTQKKNPNFLSDFTGKKQVDSWQQEDPGWTKDSFPQSPPAPVSPPVEPQVEPKVEPTPPPQPQPQPKHGPIRRQQPGCPPQGCPPRG